MHALVSSSKNQNFNFTFHFTKSLGGKKRNISQVGKALGRNQRNYFCLLPADGPWTNRLTPLILSFLAYKIRRLDYISGSLQEASLPGGYFCYVWEKLWLLQRLSSGYLPMLSTVWDNQELPCILHDFLMSFNIDQIKILVIINQPRTCFTYKCKIFLQCYYILVLLVSI